MVRICDSEQREPRNSPWLFSFSWEQRKLRDISEKVIEKNTSRAYSETFTNSAENGIISQRDYFDHNISNEENLDGYYIVRDEDFVYNPRISTTAPVGPINRNKLRRTGVMSPLYTVFRTIGIDQTFLEYFFKSHYWHFYMMFNGDSGARADRFSIKDAVFFEMPVPYPPSEEQGKIGDFLTSLDRLITLHQCKYFYSSPKSGIFHNEKTNAWEQREFEKSFSLLQNNTLSRAELSESSGVAANIHYGDVLIKFGEYLDMLQESFPWIKKQADADKFRTSFLQDGDIVFADTAEDETAGKCCEIRNCGSTVIISGLHTIPCRPVSKFAPGYLGYYLNSAAFHEQLVPLMQGTKVVSISKAALESTLIQYPSDDKEQQKIGALFRGIDRLITLHQREYLLFEVLLC